METYLIEKLYFTVFGRSQLKCSDPAAGYAYAACIDNSENTATNKSAASPIGTNKQDVELALVSFAVTKIAHDAIIPKFVKNLITVLSIP